MNRYNQGVIYTNDKCIACNKCIGNCSLMGANVCVINNGTARMEIDSRKCNDCGKCINVCVHDARSYRDDTDAFFADLKKGEKISIILAPAFFGIYGDQIEQIVGCLKSLGVDKVYDGGYGREISAYLVTKYIKDSKEKNIPNRAYISNACPALVTVIQKYHPFLLSKLIPYQSPGICSAIYAHKYLGDTNKIAYMGTCVAMKTEIESENTGGNINYNITFTRVMEKLAEYNLEEYKDKGTVDLYATGLGSLISLGGEFSDLISFFFPITENIIPLKGFSEQNMQSLYLGFDDAYSKLHPILSEVTACATGCISGPGHDAKNFDVQSAYLNLNKIKNRVYNGYKNMDSPEKFWKEFSALFKYIRPEDFTRNYTDLSSQKFKVPQSAVDEIFTDMLKDTPQKRNINCRSCGYRSCSEMVKAIAFGYSRKESCVHYVNDLLLQRLSIDHTTGLLTRSAFVRAGEELFANNPDKSYIVAVGDVNKLKIINDLYGFSVGNDVLRHIAAVLKQIAGEEGLTARLGGGSFALIMENNVDNFQRLQSCKSFDSNSLHITFPVTMHFGIRMTDDSVTVTSALDQCSLCMDYSISDVQNTYSAYTEKYSEQTHLEAEITSLMQPALDNDEFKIWFQPQYSAVTGELVGAEALCRWIKPDGTIVSPGVFIPVAEKNGFIRTLDSAIWEKAFQSVKKWIDDGIEPVPVSINISRVSFETDKFFYTIKRLKEKYSIPEKYIHFEITESAAINAQSFLNDRIQKIRNLGYQIAMDDFGSGYSSLNTLRNMPIDILKLDMGFLKGEDNLNKGGTIITYVARMAQGLEFITVAEGVETQEQADFLRSVGVNIFQGYLYAKPMPEDQFIEILKRTSNRGIIHRARTFGQVDVRKFLNPDSPESLMFEDYTGSAAIFEFDDEAEDISLLRANKKFHTIFEMEELTLAEVKKLLRGVFTKKSFEEFMACVKQNAVEDKKGTFIVEAKTYMKQLPIWVKSQFWQISQNGHSHYLYCLAEDITNEKITESTLAVSNQQLGMMMENSQVGMCLMHVTVNPLNLINGIKLRVLRVNQTFCEISGFKEDTVLKWTEKEAFRVIHPLDRPGFFAACTKAIISKFKKPFTYEYRAIKSDGTYTNVRLMVSGVQQPDKSFMMITNYIVLS